MSQPTATVKPDLSQCTYTTDKGRRCKLHPGHVNQPGNEKHRMVLRDQIAAPKPLSEVLPAGFKLTMEPVPTDAKIGREYQREAKPRDDDQKRVDKDAKRAYDAWDKAGKPSVKNADGSPNKSVPWQRYIFPPAAFDTIIAMLRRSRAVGGSVQGKALSYTRHTHESGNAMVYFVFTDGKTNGNGNG